MTSTKVGYSGGDFDDPTYADIITGKTGHAEAVRVEYDQDEISLEEILHYFLLRIARQRSIVTMHRKRLSKT